MTGIYLMCLILNAGIYMVLLGINYRNHKRYLDNIRENSVRLVRAIDLEEQLKILKELHELQSEQPNVSRSDTAIMSLLNQYIENTLRQMNYLGIKKELSETDNSCK